ncbi:MAG: TetR/AcrR family transcriptional regulator [Solirubrobacteraceae bacterium]
MAAVDARGPGRPRDARADEAILTSAARLLSERGFERMTLAAVAQGAGVSTATLHRRYRSKAELAIAVMTWMRQETQPALTGDLTADLEAMLRQLWHVLAERVGMGLIGAVLVQEREQPELAEHFRERIAQPRVAAMADLLHAGQTAGAVRRDADVHVAAELVVGAVLAHYLGGAEVSDDWFRAVTRDLVRAYAA